MTGREASKPYHHNDLRSALLEAAVGLIEETGADSLTLRSVAKRVGVSHTAPYRHFADLSELTAAVAAEGFHKLSAEFHPVRTDADIDPAQRLVELGVAYVRFAMKHPAHFRVMFREHQNKPDWLEEASQNAFQALLDTVSEGQAAGALAGTEAHEIAIPAWSIVHGLSALLVDGPRDKFMPEGAPFTEAGLALARSTVETFLHGAAAPRDSR